MRGDFTRDRSSDQREVAEEIEDLVADEFVAEAERPIDDRVVVEDDAVLHSSTARESGGAKLFDLAHKSERPRGSDLAQEVVVVVVELVALLPDHRMIEINLVLQHQA